MGRRTWVTGLAVAALVAGCGRGSAPAEPGGEAAEGAREVLVDDAVERGSGVGVAAEPAAARPAVELHPGLRATLEAALGGVEAIPEERKRELRKLALFVRTKRTSGEPANLTFICTHNSRRSHMGQLWAAAAAAWHGVEGVSTFSGGTEVTAFNPRAVAALERAGFRIRRADDAPSDNPRYVVSLGPTLPEVEAFSKVYDAPTNPSDGFAAVMTCSQADQNCPVVAGAALRVAIPYVDPKEADDTPEEAARYDERAKQIATEMLYLFSQV